MTINYLLQKYKIVMYPNFWHIYLYIHTYTYFFTLPLIYIWAPALEDLSARPCCVLIETSFPTIIKYRYYEVKSAKHNLKFLKWHTHMGLSVHGEAISVTSTRYLSPARYRLQPWWSLSLNWQVIKALVYNNTTASSTSGRAEAPRMKRMFERLSESGICHSLRHWGVRSHENVYK